jgi:hypothetical protein
MTHDERVAWLIKRATDSLWCATGRPWRLVQSFDDRYLIDADGVIVAEGLALGNAQFLVDCRTLMPELITALKAVSAERDRLQREAEGLRETVKRYRHVIEQCVNHVTPDHRLDDATLKLACRTVRECEANPAEAPKPFAPDEWYLAMADVEVGSNALVVKGLSVHLDKDLPLIQTLTAGLARNLRGRADA